MNEQLRSEVQLMLMFIFMIGLGAIIKTFNSLVDTMSMLSIAAILMIFYLRWKHKNE